MASPSVAGPLEDAYAAAQRGDYVTVLKLWMPLAEQGDAKAQIIVGGMNEGGLGVPKDYTEAMNWYGKAAAQGYAMAQISLGGMYDGGQGVPRGVGRSTNLPKSRSYWLRPRSSRALRLSPPAARSLLRWQLGHPEQARRFACREAL